jgi:3-oxoacyl-[acyl-carrier protein] reductase
MDDQKNKKVMAVIGANGGIGSTLAHSLIASGHTVALGVQDAAQCDVKGGKVFAVDATSWESVDAFLNDIETELGPVYGVALCVGSILLKPAHLTREHDFDQVINMNLKSAFAVVRSASKRMLKTGGSIVLVSSSAARRGIPNHEAIAAAKAGVIGLTVSAAATYASYGIRVNCVAPGLTRTKMAAPITGNEMSLKASTAMHPLGRIGEPEDVAGAIEWFLNPKSNWVTGQVLGVDGGLADLIKR